MRKKLTMLKIYTLASFLVFFTNAANATASEITGILNTNVTSSVSDLVDGVVMSQPVATPVAGAYTSAQSVTLLALGAGSIHYTIDGTSPNCASGVVYTGSITLGVSSVVKAVSCYAENRASSPVSFPYTIDLPPATVTAPPPVVSSGGGGGGGAFISTPLIPLNVTIISTTTNKLSSSTSLPTSLLQKSLEVPTTASTQAKQQSKVLGATTYAFTHGLSLGMKGNDVTQLQLFLTQSGVYSGSITGYFGSLTKAAVIALQKKNSLQQVGSVGPKTLALLNKGIFIQTSRTEDGVLGTSTVAVQPVAVSKSSLTIPQIQSIIGLLLSFGASQTIIESTNFALGGK